MTDYRLKSKRIIKWYEYNMQYPEDENTSDVSDDIPDAQEVQDTLNTMIDDEEEIDLATTGLDEDDQALVADIMVRFKEAKQNTVDDLFSALSDDSSSADTNSDTSSMSEDELIAAICTPKQDNVDAFIGKAQSDM